LARERTTNHVSGKLERFSSFAMAKPKKTIIHRACHRVRCRKSRNCRGDTAACLNYANVPEPAREWGTRLMVAGLAPWLPRLGARDVERVAYEAWVAGIEAGQ
jgi:hypothetical protein